MPFVLIDRPRPHITLITLNRPERMNAMAFDVMVPFGEALKEVSRDNDTRVVVITGAGRGFCSGADLESPGDIPGIDGLTLPTIALRSMELLDDVIRAMRRVHQPVIAAINGPAIGGGLCLSARRASPSSTSASPPTTSKRPSRPASRTAPRTSRTDAPGAAWQGGRMPKLSPDEARRLLTTAPVVRLATVGEDARPHLVPVTFTVHRGTVYTAVDHKPKSTRDLRRLANIRANPHVSLLADHYEDDWDRLWWVRVDGHANIVEDPAHMAEPVRLLAGRYAQYRDRPPEGPVIAITIDGWNGWSAS